MEIFYILAGAFVGFAVGLTGVGGGSLMTPLLLLFGFPAQIAIGTDLLFAAITKSSGIITHHRQKTITWPIVRLLCITSLPASLVTIFLLKYVFGDAGQYTRLLTSSLGIMLILTACVLVFRKQLLALRAKSVPDCDAHQQRAKVWTIVMGLLLGVFVTLSSVGAGAFGAALLLLLYPKLTASHVVGTDLAHAVPLTLIAGIGHLALGHVDYQLLVALLIGSIPAIHLGAKLSKRMPERLLKSLLAFALLVLGVKFAVF